MGQLEFQSLLGLLKALADESRLKILGFLANRECSVKELAALLDLKEPTVSHHLAKLKETGVIDMRSDGNNHFYRLDSNRLRSINKEIFTPEHMSSLVAEMDMATGEQKVLNNFLEGEKLKRIPATHKKLLVILQWLATRFKPDVKYREREVNEIIKRHHPDCATLRRELIGNGFMRREKGVYWLLP